MACEPLGPRKAPSKRGIKHPKQKKCKSVAKPPLLVLPENQAEVNEGPPFVPKLKALATNLMATCANKIIRTYDLIGIGIGLRMTFLELCCGGT